MLESSFMKVNSQKGRNGRSIEYIIFIKECQIYVRSLVSVWVYCLHYPLMHNKYSLQWTFVFCPFQMEHAWREKKKYIWACSQYKISINVMWLESHLIIGWALFVLSGLIHVWLLPLDYLHVLLNSNNGIPGQLIMRALSVGL